MAKTFNLTANLVLAGPANLKPIVSSIQGALNNIKADVDVKINAASVAGINALNSAFKTFSATLIVAKTNINNVAIALGQLNSSINNVKLPNLTQQLAQVNTQQKTLNNSLRAGTTELEEFGRVSGLAVRRFVGFAATTGVIMGLISAFKNATGAAIDFQNQMVKLAQLTGGSVTSMYKQFGDQITQLSVGLGVSSAKLGEIAHKLVQAGLSAKDMAQVMEALAKSMNAPAFHDVDQTMEGTIAMMKQFGIRANDVEASLSSMHAMASKYAVESQDLITAIRISGGAFSSMSKGVVEGREALNQFMATFTSVRGTTRESAESIATGLRTIFARLERPEAIIALKQLGVELVDLNGKFIGPYEAINKLSGALKSMDPKDIRYAEVAESLGGYRQIGKVLPLLQQTELRMKAFKTAQEGSNQLNEANVKAMQSWEVQLGKVHERFLALVRDVSQSQGFKDLMNIFLGMANGLVRLGEALQPILPLLAVFMTYKGAMAGGELLTGLTKGLRGRQMASGGLVPGFGDGDTVPATLTPGEFVIRKKAVQTIGAAKLHEINQGYAQGGSVKFNVATLENKPDVVSGDMSGPEVFEAMNKASNSGHTKLMTAPNPAELFNRRFHKGNKVPFEYNVVVPVSKTNATHFDTMAEQGFKGLVQGLAQTVAGDMKATIADIPDINKIGFQSVKGNLFEGAIHALGAPFIKEKNTTTFDFYAGLGDASKYFTPMNDSPLVEAKKSLGSDSYASLSKKIANYAATEVENIMTPEDIQSADVNKMRAQMKAAKDKKKAPHLKAMGGFVQHFAEGGKKTAMVYDFDDTLAHINGEAGPNQFADFRKPELIKQHAQPTSLLAQAKIAQLKHDIYVLTARASVTNDAIDEFAKENGLNLTGVIGVGDMYGDVRVPGARPGKTRNARTPDKKVLALKELSEKYIKLGFFDDSEENIAAVRSANIANVKSKLVKTMADGGDSGTDTVNAKLTPGEFVINKDAAAALGQTQLHKLNNADRLGFAKGGPVPGFVRGGTVPGFSKGGGKATERRIDTLAETGATDIHGMIDVSLMTQLKTEITQAVEGWKAQGLRVKEVNAKLEEAKKLLGLQSPGLGRYVGVQDVLQHVSSANITQDNTSELKQNNMLSKTGIKTGIRTLGEHLQGASLVSGGMLQMMGPDNKYMQAAGSAMEGAAIGGKFGGPYGAVVGAAIGGAGSLLQAGGREATKKADEELVKTSKALDNAFDRLKADSKTLAVSGLEEFNRALHSSVAALEQKTQADILVAKTSAGNLAGGEVLKPILPLLAVFMTHKGASGLGTLATSDAQAKVNENRGFFGQISHNFYSTVSDNGVKANDQAVESMRNEMAGTATTGRQQLAARLVTGHEKIHKETEYDEKEKHILAYSGENVEQQQEWQKRLITAKEVDTTNRGQGLRSNQEAITKEAIEHEEIVAADKIIATTRKRLDEEKELNDTMVRGEAILARFESQMKISMATLEKAASAGIGHIAMAQAEGGKNLMHFTGENVFKNPLAYNDIGTRATTMAGQFGKVGEPTTQAATYLQNINSLEQKMDEVFKKASENARGAGNTQSAQIGLTQALNGLPEWKALPEELKKQMLAKINTQWETSTKKGSSMTTEAFLNDPSNRKQFMSGLDATKNQSAELFVKMFEHSTQMIQTQVSLLEKELALRGQINDKTAALIHMEGQQELVRAKAINPYAHITSEQAYAPVKAQLGTLAQAGQLRANQGTDVNAVGNRLAFINKSLQENRQNVVDAGNNVAEVTELNKLGVILQAQKDALEKQLGILHTDNTNIQAIQEDMAYLQKKHEAAGDLLERFVNSNMQERFKMVREINTASKFNETGVAPRSMLGQQWVYSGQKDMSGIVGPEAANTNRVKFGTALEGQFGGPGALNQPLGQLIQQPDKTREGQELIMKLDKAQKLQIDAGAIDIKLGKADMNFVIGQANLAFRGGMAAMKDVVTPKHASGGIVKGNYPEHHTQIEVGGGEAILRAQATTALQKDGIPIHALNHYDTANKATKKQLASKLHHYAAGTDDTLVPKELTSRTPPKDRVNSLESWYVPTIDMNSLQDKPGYVPRTREQKVADKEHEDSLQAPNSIKIKPFYTPNPKVQKAQKKKDIYANDNKSTNMIARPNVDTEHQSLVNHITTQRAISTEIHEQKRPEIGYDTHAPVHIGVSTPKDLPVLPISINNSKKTVGQAWKNIKTSVSSIVKPIVNVVKTTAKDIHEDYMLGQIAKDEAHPQQALDELMAKKAKHEIVQNREIAQRRKDEKNREAGVATSDEFKAFFGVTEEEWTGRNKAPTVPKKEGTINGQPISEWRKERNLGTTVAMPVFKESTIGGKPVSEWRKEHGLDKKPIINDSLTTWRAIDLFEENHHRNKGMMINGEWFEGSYADYKKTHGGKGQKATEGIVPFHTIDATKDTPGYRDEKTGKWIESDMGATNTHPGVTFTGKHYIPTPDPTPHFAPDVAVKSNKNRQVAFAAFKSGKMSGEEYRKIQMRDEALGQEATSQYVTGVANPQWHKQQETNYKLEKSIRDQREAEYKKKDAEIHGAKQLSRSTAGRALLKDKVKPATMMDKGTELMGMFHEADTLNAKDKAIFDANNREKTNRAKREAELNVLNSPNLKNIKTEPEGDTFADLSDKVYSMRNAKPVPRIDMSTGKQTMVPQYTEDDIRNAVGNKITGPQMFKDLGIKPVTMPNIPQATPTATNMIPRTNMPMNREDIMPKYSANIIQQTAHGSMSKGLGIDAKALEALQALGSQLANIPQTIAHEIAPMEHTHRIIGESVLANSIVGAISDHISQKVDTRVAKSINPVTGETNSQAYG